MHEVGALYEIVRTVESIAKEQHAEKIDFINLELGELSGMLPYFFENYYPVVIEDRPMFQDSTLHVSIIAGEGVCTDCDTHYNIKEYEGACPNCGSRNKVILSGRDLMITQVGLFFPDETSSDQAS